MNLRACLTALILLGTTSCAPPPPATPYAEGIQPESNLGLVRVIWDRGTRPDAFCVPDIGDDIGYRLRLGLERRGYRIIRIDVPPLDNSFAPDPVADWSPDMLFDRTPDINRLLRVRVVEYLDASLCDTDRHGTTSTSLDITAVAEIFSRGQSGPVWQTTQRCSVLAGNTSDTVRLCVNELTEGIWMRLPRAVH